MHPLRELHKLGRLSKLPMTLCWRFAVFWLVDFSGTLKTSCFNSRAYIGLNTMLMSLSLN
jgi:hypothetical protein